MKRILFFLILFFGAIFLEGNAFSEYDKYAYVGCYTDPSASGLSERALDGDVIDKWDRMDLQTPTWCVDYCEPKGFTYAGWQSHWCYCGNKPDKYGKTDENKCTTVCPGDPSKKCGGLDAISVYATGAGSVTPPPPPPPVTPPSASCSYFNEDFSGASGNTWTSLYGRWYTQDGKLNADSIEASTMAHHETDFFAPDFFNIDVDVASVSASHNNAAFGFYPYNSGDVFFDVDTRSVSGVGVLVYPNLNSVRLLAWDVPAQVWYQSGELSLPASLSSIGVSYTADAVTLRINGRNTSLRFSSDFSYSYQVLNKLRLLAQESGTHVRFDNICAYPLGTAPPAPKQYMLTVNKSGTGSGSVTSTPAGIDCGTDCSETYAEGAPVTLTATPGQGSTFNGWSGAGCSGTGPCSVTMNAETSVSAEFAPTAGQVPVPDIMIGQDLSVSLGLNAGGMAGMYSDWWIIAYSYTADQWYHFELMSFFFQPGIAGMIQFGLINFPLTQLMNLASLPSGSYLVCFAVDTTPDWTPSNPFYYDCENVVK